jgi:purine-binding chemotaxis protein CheW
MTTTHETPDAAPDEAADQLQLVCFALADHRFGVPIDLVKEAVALRPITPVFLVPDFVRGIMNLRGEVVAVLDLLRLLGFRPSTISEHSRVVIARHGRGRGAGQITGLLADRLSGVIAVAPAAIRPPPATLPTAVSDHVRGVISEEEHPLLVLDLDRIFNTEALAPFHPVVK